MTQSGGPDPNLLAPFTDGLHQLADAGCRIIGTSCGFLAPFQADLAQSSPVPFLSSALLMAKQVQAILGPKKKVGIITFDETRLGPSHLDAAEVPNKTVVVGLEPGSALHRAVLKDEPEMNLEAVEKSVLEAGDRLKLREPALGAVVLECTNLGPYKTSLSRHLGVPVHDVVEMLEGAMGS